MGRTLHARLKAYEPFGEPLGILPDPVSFNASFLHDDDGALTLTYSRRSRGGEILSRRLEQGLEIAVEVSDGGEYVEPCNGRFLVIARSGDSADDTDTISINSAPSISWLLSKILNNDTGHLVQDGDNKGKRAFLGATPGTILNTFLQENRERGGAATGLTVDFDTAKDSSGEQWKSKSTLYYSLGVSLQSALSSLVGGGILDWRTEGRAIRCWNADSTDLSRDLSGTDIIHLADGLREAPYEESISGLASNILVAGDNGLVFRLDNPAAPKPWGEWESYVSQGGISDEGTARAFMQSQLETAARVRGQYTRDVNVTGTRFLPLVDYRPGDWITAPTIGHGEKVRVQQITIGWQNGETTASIVLNDKRYDVQVRDSKKIQGITGGAVLAGSQNGGVNTGRDHRVPKAPQGLILSTDAYLDANGYARALVTAGWGEVTQATDDTAIEIADYQVEWRYSDEETWRFAGTKDGTSLSWSNLDCGRTVIVRVRAMPSYSDRPGEWSDEASVRAASDAIPPSVPSGPLLSSEMGVVTIHWDGRNTSDGGMEPDFDHLEVGRGSSAGALTVVSASIIDVDDFVDTNVSPGETWSYAFRAVDHSGNRSEWSATAQVTVASAVTSEQVEQIRQDLQDNDEAIEQANKELQDNKTALQETNKTVAQVQQTVDDNRSTITQTQQTVSQMQGSLSQAQKDIQSNQTAIEQANKELDTVGRTASDAAAKAQQAITDAVGAQTTADGKNRVLHDWQDPRTTDPTLKPSIGDLWYRYQRYWTTSLGDPDNSPSALADFYTYSDGEPDNSPSVLVSLDSEIVEVLIWNGTGWNTYTMVASNVIVSGTITGDLIAARTIVGDNIAAGTITGDKIVSLSITADKLAANSVNAEKIVSGSISTEKLAAGAVTASKIAALTITGDLIAANAISTDKIAANAVTAAKIAALSVTTDKLAAGSVNAGKIAAGAVTADKLAANSVNAEKIVSGAITADKLAANSVTAVKIAAGSITTDKIAAGQFHGYVFTGAIYQSSTSENTGFKLRDSGLDMWDSSHNHTVHLDGNGSSNLLTGSFQTAMSGRRVRISPDFSQHMIGSTDVSTGSGIQFFLDGSAYDNPYIASESSVTSDGDVSAIVINGGQRQSSDPGAYMRVGMRGAAGSRKGVVYLTASQNYLNASSPRSYLNLSAPEASGPTALLRADNGERYAGCYANGDGAYSYMYAGDANGIVGVQADIDSGYLYMGGYLGQVTGRGTLQATNWKIYSNANIPLQYTIPQTTWTFGVPAKYGRYYGVCSSDVNWGSIFLHVCNTGGASSMQVMGFNTGSSGSAFTGDVYAEALAWLVK